MSSTNASLSNIAKNQGSKTLNNSKKAVNKQMKGFKQASPLKKVFIVLVIVMLFLFILYWINFAIKQKNNASTQNPVIISSPIDAWKNYNKVSISLPHHNHTLLRNDLIKDFLEILSAFVKACILHIFSSFMLEFKYGFSISLLIFF